MERGEVEKAIREALHRFDQWLDVTGALQGSYRYEVQSLIEDGVRIGIRAANGLPYVDVEKL